MVKQGLELNQLRPKIPVESIEARDAKLAAMSIRIPAVTKKAWCGTIRQARMSPISQRTGFATNRVSKAASSFPILTKLPGLE